MMRPNASLDNLPTNLRPTVSRIGRFVVLEKLGEGGMGVVYAGYDDRLDRRVALKVLHAGPGTDAEGAKRLWREAQAMARLSHPNVVSVHEVVQAEGTVFVVMEFVRGQTLTQWLDSEPSWQEVLEAFVAAGEGLGAAHELGMVHRDFKPSNVMRSDEGAVKVLDFGLARAVRGGSATGGGGASMQSEVTPRTAGALSSSATVTVAGTVMGTLSYMSPEQQEGVELDARSDQYSFCVAAWACLTGRQPFRGGAPEAVLLAKLEGPPRWPKGAPAVPARVVDALRRGLAVDPEDRWGSMQALLGELRWDPRQRRRRRSLGLAGLAVASVGGLAAQSWAGQRSERCSGAADKLVGVWDEGRKAEAKAAMQGVQRGYATQAWAHAESTLDAYAGEWADMHMAACETGTNGGDEALLDARMRCLERSRMGLEATVDTLVNADAQVVEKTHEVMGGLRPLQWCADEEALTAQEEPPLPREAAAVARARKAISRSSSERAAGRIDAARKALREAQAALANVEYGPVLAELAVEAGEVYKDNGEFPAAEASFAEGLELALAHGSARELFHAAGSLLAVVADERGQVAEGLRYWPVVEALSRGNEIRTVRALQRMASILLVQGRETEAEAKFREVIRLQEGLNRLDRASATRSNLGLALLRSGRYLEAQKELLSALRDLEATRGSQHPHAVSIRANLVAVAGHLEEYEKGEAECRKVLQLAQTALGPEHPTLGSVHRTCGTLFLRQGRFEEAKAQLQAALEIIARAFGPEHVTMGHVRGSLAIISAVQGRYEEAKAGYLESLRLSEKSYGRNHPEVALRWFSLGTLALRQKQFADAENCFLTSLRIQDEALEPDLSNVAGSHYYLASIKWRQGLLTEALPWAEKAWEWYRQDHTFPDMRGNSAFLLGEVLWRVAGPKRDRRRPYDLVHEAAQSYQAAGADSHPELLAAQEWLKRHDAPKRGRG